MNEIMLVVKFLLFYGMWFVTLSLLGAVVLAGLVWFLRNQARVIRRGPFEPLGELYRPLRIGHKGLWIAGGIERPTQELVREVLNHNDVAPMV